jgi:hypothetical protein
MRKALIIALGLASLGAIASVQPAGATGYKCVPVNCHTVPLGPGQLNHDHRNPLKPPVVCEQRCTQIPSQGSGGPAPSISDPKLRAL